MTRESLGDEVNFPEYAGMLQRVMQIAGGEQNLRSLLPSSYANDSVNVAAEEYLMRVVERVALEDVLNANQKGVWNFFKAKLKKWFGGDRTLATLADKELAEMARSIYRRSTTPESPKPSNRWEAFTPENNGRRVGGIWQIVDADSLKTSTDKGYDDKLQPRNRQRKGSDIQTAEIATNLNPDLLGASAKSSDGAPIVDSRGMVVSGNGRTLAIRKAYGAEKTERAEAYKNFVLRQAEKLGLDVSANIKKPMLVRRVDDLGGLSMEDFAARSNKSDLAGMSNAENAIADARRILDAHLLDRFFPSDNGDVLAASNNDFITGFLDIIGGREEYIDKNGARKSNLAPRIKSAVLAAMLNPEKRDIVEDLLDNPQGWSGLINGLFGSVANLAKLDGNADYNLADELSQAVEIFVGLQRAGESVATFNAQGDMFKEPISDEVGFLIELFEKNTRTPSGISGVLNEYYNLVKNIDTTTQDIFGAENPSKVAELRAAYQKYSTSLTEEPNVSWRDTGEPTDAEIKEAQRQKDEVKAKWTNPDGTMKKGYHLAPNGKESKLTEEQWLWVRTPNFKKWFGDWENDPENASKMVDENGEPLVVYHGTAWEPFAEKAGDAVFKDESYFTANKNYANRYKKGGEVYGFFLNIRKPFDTRNSKEREIFEKEFYRKWGNGAPLSEHGLPDWTDGTDLLEFLQEKGYDYDSLFLDEGGDGGYGDAVSYRGESYVPLNANQIKSATDNVGTYSRNPDIRWSIREDYEAEKINRQFRELYERYKNGDKAAYEEAAKLVADYAKSKGYNVKVYHGTGADGFNVAKSDASEAQNGEGAQAHGMGLYLATEKRTAEGYQDRARKPQPIVKINGKVVDAGKMSKDLMLPDLGIIEVLQLISNFGYDSQLKYLELQKKAAEDALKLAESGVDEFGYHLFDEGKKSRINRANEEIEFWQRDIDNLQRLVDWVKKNLGADIVNDSRSISVTSPKGKVFEWFTNLKPENVLDEDGLPGDLDFFQFAIMENPDFWDAVREKVEERNPNKSPDEIDEIYNEIEKGAPSWEIDTQSFLRILKDIGFTKSEISQLLLKCGFKGITYDGRQDGRCYVSFEGGSAVKLQDPFTFDDNGELIPLSERFDLGNPDMRWRFVGENGMRNLENLGSKNASNLELAKEMLARGETPSNIWRKTGWFKNPKDGKWRYELDDGEIINAPFKENSSQLLSNVLDDTDLYLAYPNLKNKQVIFRDIAIGGAYFDGKNFYVDNSFTDNPKGLKEILIHEIQHFIQIEEGFVRGANEAMFTSENSKFLDWRFEEVSREYDELRAERKRVYEESGLSEKIREIADDDDFVEKYKKLLEESGVKEVLAEIDDKISQKSDELWELHEERNNEETGISPFEKYMRVAGEVEARNAAARQRQLSPDMRRKIFPEATQDIPFDKQIIGRNDRVNPDMRWRDVEESPNLFEMLKNLQGESIPEESLEKNTDLDYYFEYFKKNLLEREIQTPIGKVARFNLGHFNKLIARGENKGESEEVSSLKEWTDKIKHHGVDLEKNPPKGFDYARACNMPLVVDVLQNPQFVLVDTDDTLLFVKKYGEKTYFWCSVMNNGETLGIKSWRPLRLTKTKCKQLKVVYTKESGVVNLAQPRESQRSSDSTNLSENQENNSRLRFLLRQERTENPVIWASIVLAKEILNGRGITRAKVEKVLPTAQFDGSKQNYAVERAQRIAEKTKATQKHFTKDLDIAIRKAESDLYWQDEFVENAYRSFSKGGEEYGFAKQKLMQYLKDLKNRELNKVKGYETNDFDVDLVDAILKAQEAEPERAVGGESKAAGEEVEEELEEADGAFEGDDEFSGKKTPLAPSKIRDVIGAIRREVVKRVRDSDGDRKTLDEKYRKTLVNVLTDAMKELVYGKEREDIGRKIEELKNVKHAVITVKDGERVGQKIDNFTLRAENIALRIFKRGVRDDKKTMTDNLDAILARRGKKPSRMQREDKRSMAGLVQQRIYNISKYVEMDAEELENARREVVAKLENVDENFVQDAENGKIREDVEDVRAEVANAIHDIEMFGGWADKSRAEMAEALVFLEKTIDTETAAQKVRVQERKERNASVRKIISDALKMSEHNAAFDGGLRVAIRKVLNGSLPFDSFLGLLGECATGEKRRLFEQWRRDFVARVDRAANAKANEVFQIQQKFIKLVEDSYKTDFHDALKRLLEKKGEYEKFSKPIEGKVQPMSLANVIQLYVSAAQKNYERNIYEHRAVRSPEYKKLQDEIDEIRSKFPERSDKTGDEWESAKARVEELEKRQEQMRESALEDYMKSIEKLLSDGDRRFIAGLRQLYKDGLPSISAVAKRVIGLPIEQADALYMPVKVKRSGNLGEGVPQVPVVPKSLSPRVPHLRDLDETADPISLFTDRISENAQFKYFSELYLEIFLRLRQWCSPSRL